MKMQSRTRWPTGSFRLTGHADADGHRLRRHAMFMHRIKLENILSFGPDAQELELEPLNVLIGPNGSGKSNLIEAIGLLRAAPSDVMAPIREGGGSGNWIWRGEPRATEARLEVVLGGPLFRSREQPLRYSVKFDPNIFGAFYLGEELEVDERSVRDQGSSERYLQRSGGKVVLSYLDDSGGRKQRELPSNEIKASQSVLSTTQGPISIP